MSDLDSPLLAAGALMPDLVVPGVFLRGDEALRITTFNSVAGVNLSIEGLFFLAGVGPRAFADRHVPNTDRTSASSMLRLGEGWLQTLHVRVTAGTVARGECYVLVEIVRGSDTANASPLGTLIQGYVTSSQRRGMIGAPHELTTEGPGNVRVVTGNDPAAGAEHSQTVPAGARWRLLAWSAVLVTDATVASRLPALIIDDGANNLLASICPTALTAGTTTTVTASDFGQLAGTAGAVAVIALPRHLILRPGFRIRTSTVAIVAGDNWGPARMWIEEWIDG